MSERMDRWGGTEFLILGAAADKVARLHERLAPFVPEAAAFTSFQEAFEHAKKRRTVGMVVLLDDLAGLPAADVVAQLGRHREATGWPCLALAVAADALPAAAFARSLAGCRRLLGYLPAGAFDERAGAAAELGRLWHAYVRAVEEHLLPPALAETLAALAEPVLPRASQRFLERVANLLGGVESGVGLTWLELIAVRWQPVFAALARAAPAAAAANPALAQVARLAEKPGLPADLAGILASPEPVAARVAAFAGALDAARRSGRLAEALKKLERRARPRDEEGALPGGAGDAAWGGSPRGRASPPLSGKALAAGDALARRAYGCGRQVLRIAGEVESVADPGEAR
ncbi:MAG: hypothetical protein HY927_08095 [Elusimicrobia bacterium]|nr:hypothetical protein [Elusimicrobiota bacterium]